MGKGEVADKTGTGNRARGQNRPEPVGNLSRLGRAGFLSGCLVFDLAVTGTGDAALLERLFVGAARETPSLWPALLSGDGRRDCRVGISMLLEAQEAVAEQSLQQLGLEAKIGPLPDDKLDSLGKRFSGFGSERLDQLMHVAPVHVDFQDRNPGVHYATLDSGFDEPPGRARAHTEDGQGLAIGADAGQNCLGLSSQEQRLHRVRLLGTRCGKRQSNESGTRIITPVLSVSCGAMQGR